MTIITQAELLAKARERFGPDPLDWAFRCPICGDVATGHDFRAALAEHPRSRGDDPVTASDLVGQECIGRTLGALSAHTSEWTGRGCDWCAYGLIPGPWTVTLPDGRALNSFPLADPAESEDQ